MTGENSEYPLINCKCVESKKIPGDKLLFVRNQRLRGIVEINNPQKYRKMSAARKSERAKIYREKKKQEKIDRIGAKKLARIERIRALKRERMKIQAENVSGHIVLFQDNLIKNDPGEEISEAIESPIDDKTDPLAMGVDVDLHTLGNNEPEVKTYIYKIRKPKFIFNHKKQDSSSVASYPELSFEKKESNSLFPSEKINIFSKPSIIGLQANITLQNNASAPELSDPISYQNKEDSSPEICENTKNEAFSIPEIIDHDYAISHFLLCKIHSKYKG